MAGHAGTFHQRLAEALNSSTLSLALDRALPTFRQRRALAFQGEDFPALQADLAARRAQHVAQIPDLLERFQQAAERAGAVVHRARDAAEACALVGDLVERYGVRLVVKSKSMVTEEVGLNAYLSARGVQVVETDLGEFIVQLAQEHPSHLLAPALHKTREEIARLFSALAGREIPPEIPQLVAFARDHLRRFFIEAGMGVSGANIAIAESGTLVILENEGNARLVTTLPPVHVALVGLEKLVPTIDDATAILKLLSRSATGQPISTYISFITGPSRSADIELSLTTGVHGPKAVHIIFVDNGRTAMRDDPEFRAALQCIRCGACANVCPAFQEVGGHIFGHIYTGPIGLVVTPFHHGLEHISDPQRLCLGCNTCDTVCPAGIPLASLILSLRERVVARKGLPLPKRLALDALAQPALFDRLFTLASWLQRPFTDGPYLARWPLDHLTAWRRLPALNPRPLRRRLPAVLEPLAPLIPGSQAEGLTVAYFAGCLTDRLFPASGEALVQVLRRLGCRVLFPAGQHCCGLPAVNAGAREHARRLAQQTIQVLEAVPADYIVSGAASCVVSVRQDYPRLFADAPDWQDRARRVAARLLDFTHFLTEVARLPAGSLAVGPRWTVTYHDSCQSHHCLRLTHEPRWIIREVLGLDLVEMPESSACCGFGGSFSLEFPEVSARILRRKLQAIAATGATTVVADNPGCLMQIRGGLAAAGQPIQVLHLAELVARRLTAVASPPST